MSLEDKIRKAATAAAIDATRTERERCVAVLDTLIRQLQADLEKKLLIETQRHLIQTKLKLAQGIVALARQAILSGVRPSDGTSPPEKGPSLLVE